MAREAIPIRLPWTPFVKPLRLVKRVSHSASCSGKPVGSVAKIRWQSSVRLV